MATGLSIRPAVPTDYDAIAGVVDDWWGRPVLRAIPRLFLDHFAGTSLVAEHRGQLAGFLIGFFAPEESLCAYIHFVGVHPNRRGTGLARELYGRFGAAARAHGCTVIRAITSPGNAGSVAFHRALGFVVDGPIADYNGPGRDMITFELRLGQ
ncbi:GNAT family N-acetyltransferase [Nocardia sp. CDC153]|uniref:GNAT family N-acetyltransferase n=1 Tax=Nocardia sp. CDC153 TaxID=3112167 RepID=UPI002DBBA3EE|nr:GNAT family N-acetyltransferase [Nocardia sp. CDC153]MEC3958329.1 GNAT family N-acetyltransferase [Nocardia sp. CDC153]